MKNLIQTALITLVAASAADAQQAVQWRVEDGGNGHWFQIFVPSQSPTWESAAAIAVARGGFLASLNSQAEFDFVRALATSSISAWRLNSINGSEFVGPWLGGFRTDGEGESAGAWRWADGTALDCAALPCDFNDWICGGLDGRENKVQMIHQGGTFGAPTRIVLNDLPNRGYCEPTWGPVPSAIIEWSADCNSDGIVDYGQILDGTFADVNADGIPDACQSPCIPADLNNDRSVDGADLGMLVSAWGPAGLESARADINGNGIVDGADLGILLSFWGRCTN